MLAGYCPQGTLVCQFVYFFVVAFFSWKDVNVKLYYTILTPPFSMQAIVSVTPPIIRIVCNCCNEEDPNSLPAEPGCRSLKVAEGLALLSMVSGVCCSATYCFVHVCGRSK